MSRKGKRVFLTRVEKTSTIIIILISMSILMTQERYLTPQIQHDLKQKMVFVGGPRQVGKTTLAKTFLTSKEGYLNWDVAAHRQALLQYQLPVAPLWIFDEIHKYRLWRNYLKGIYDNKAKEQEILVTGSARLDYYRYSGDSLQGRYHYLRLHPLSLAELNAHHAADLMELLQRGGFPEPFFSYSQVEANRWSREYRTRLIREDLQELERVQNFGQVELLALSLPERVGSPLSINALREDLQVSHKTLSNWLQMLERLYVIFRLPPFGAPKLRAVKKECKHYHYDWALVKKEDLRFENLVACALLKWVHYQQDCLGEEKELYYFRDVEGREVDFVLTADGKPTHFIECKWDDEPVSSALKYLKLRFPEAEAWQISATGTKDYLDKHQIRACPAQVFLSTLV